MNAMNDLDSNRTHAALSDQIAALQRQTFILLLALVVVSGTIAGYLYYQSRVMSKTIESVKPQATQMIQTYRQVSANINRAQLETFLNQINAFAVTHPDFQPILKKYGWNPAAAPAK
jgi:CHASE3 domain sensor protein